MLARTERSAEPSRSARLEFGADAPRVPDAAGAGWQHAARAAPERRARRRRDRAREARVPQSRRLDQGPDRDHDGRGGGARREARAGRDDRRADLRQHRHGPRDRGRAQGLPLHLHDARQDEPREDLAAQGLRRRGDHLPLRRRAGVARELLLRLRPARRGDSGRVQARPVPQPEQPARPLRDHRPRDLGADRRRARRARDRGRHRRHRHGHGALPQGAEPRRADRRRRPRGLDLHLRPREAAPLPRRGDRRGLLSRRHSTPR